MKRIVLPAAVALLAVSAAGCGFRGAYSLPLPGGASHGKQVTVHAVFSDVQDLVPDSAVRVNDVAVGTVTNITLTKPSTELGRVTAPQRADVTLSINAPVAANLPKNTVAEVEQTSLLGEKFVALSAPSTGATGHLTNGETITDGSTTTLPDVEQVFGALSLVLNNGDLQDLQTIDVEVSKALDGREQAVRGALTQITKFVSDLDAQRGNIVRALTELNRLSTVLNKQRSTISDALDNLGPGLKVLANENGQFTKLLTDLAHFGKVADHIINNSRQATVYDLRKLQPVLHHLAAAGSNVPHALEILVTYPFPHNIGADAPGDYTGLDASLDAGQNSLLSPLCSLLSAIGALGLDQACPQETKNAPAVHGPAAAPKTSKNRHTSGGAQKKGTKSGTVPKLPVKLKLPKLLAPTKRLLHRLLRHHKNSVIRRLLGGLTG